MNAKAKKAEVQTEEPALDALLSALNTFNEHTDEIRKIRERVSEGEKEINRLANDVTVAPSVLTKKAREVRNGVDDSEFEISAIENRLLAMIKPFDNLARDADAEASQIESAHDDMVKNVVDDLMTDPKLHEGVKLLKIVLTHSTSPLAILNELGLQRIDEANYHDVAREAGYSYTRPVRSGAMDRARQIKAKANYPDRTYSQTIQGPKLKWYDVA